VAEMLRNPTTHESQIVIGGICPHACGVEVCAQCNPRRLSREELLVAGLLREMTDEEWRGGVMAREKTDRYCMQCRKPMRRAERVEMGWSVMTGRIAVCSEACRLRWNDPRSPVRPSMGVDRG